MIAMLWGALTCKFHSYAMVQRKLTSSENNEPIHNELLHNTGIIEFLFLPTLIYTPQRHLGPPTRWLRVLSEILVCAEIFITMNIIRGCNLNSPIHILPDARLVIPVILSDFPFVLKTLLLTVPCDTTFHLTWDQWLEVDWYLCSTYVFWHSILTILSELTRFADGHFFGDWWWVAKRRVQLLSPQERYQRERILQKVVHASPRLAVPSPTQRKVFICVNCISLVQPKLLQYQKYSLFLSFDCHCSVFIYARGRGWISMYQQVRQCCGWQWVEFAHPSWLMPSLASVLSELFFSDIVSALHICRRSWIFPA